MFKRRGNGSLGRALLSLVVLVALLALAVAPASEAYTPSTAVGKVYQPSYVYGVYTTATNAGVLIDITGSDTRYTDSVTVKNYSTNVVMIYANRAAAGTDATTAGTGSFRLAQNEEVTVEIPTRKIAARAVSASSSSLIRVVATY